MTASWTSEPLRVFQHLLRETDAIGLDPARLIDEARAMSANCYLSMGGGFSAWYPTTITHQRRNPYIEDDFLGGVAEAARQAGMRLLVRMDMSKGCAGAEAAHPESYVRRLDGCHATVWDLPQVCATGPVWQEVVFAILDEILSRYSVDGFFFNYLHVPRCYCDRCRSIVSSATGADVPAPGQRNSAYERWRRSTLATQAERVRDFIVARQPQAVFIPYHHLRDGWDTARMAEIAGISSAQVSNPVMPNPIDPQPMWNHWAAEEALLARAVKPVAAPFLIQSTSAFFASRQTALPAARLTHNLVQTAAHGAGTAPALNGRLAQEDGRAIPALAAFGAHLAQHAGWYRGLRSMARIAIVRSEPSRDWGPDAGRPAGHPTENGHVAEFRGLFEMLATLRYPLDLAHAGRLTAAGLAGYGLVLLPAVTCLSDVDAAAIDAYVLGGGTLLATADLGAADAEGVARGRPALSCLPALPGAASDATGGYFTLGHPDLRHRLHDLPHIGAGGAFWRPVDAATPAWEREMLLLGPFTNNAPEFTVVGGPVNGVGLLTRRHGGGTAHWLPWRPGAHYHRHGISDYRDILGHLAETAVGAPPIALPVGEAVDAILYRHPRGALLHLNNGAAVAGRPQSDCTPLAGFEITLAFPVEEAILLNTGARLPLTRSGGGVSFALPRLEDYAAIALVQAVGGGPPD